MSVEAGYNDIAGDIDAAFLQNITECYCHYVICTYNSIRTLPFVMY